MSLILIGLLSLANAAPPKSPPNNACVNGNICVETKLKAKETLDQRCEKKAPKCARAPKTDGVCSLGDVTMVHALAGKTGDELAGTVLGAQKGCHGAGGSFTLAGKKVTKPAPARTSLVVPSLKTKLQAPADCVAEQALGGIAITCGGTLRPPVTLQLVPLLDDGSDLLAPKGPEDALSAVEDATVRATITGVKQKTNKDGTWRLDYALVPPHGVRAFGFQEARRLGTRRFLCTASAFSAGDLAEAGKLCAGLTSAP